MVPALVGVGEYASQIGMSAEIAETLVKEFGAAAGVLIVRAVLYSKCQNKTYLFHKDKHHGGFDGTLTKSEKGGCNEYSICGFEELL